MPKLYTGKITGKYLKKIIKNKLKNPIISQNQLKKSRYFILYQWGNTKKIKLI